MNEHHADPQGTIWFLYRRLFQAEVSYPQRQKNCVWCRSPEAASIWLLPKWCCPHLMISRRFLGSCYILLQFMYVYKHLQTHFYRSPTPINIRYYQSPQRLGSQETQCQAGSLLRRGKPAHQHYTELLLTSHYEFWQVSDKLIPLSPTYLKSALKSHSTTLLVNKISPRKVVNSYSLSAEDEQIWIDQTAVTEFYQNLSEALLLKKKVQKASSGV